MRIVLTHPYCWPYVRRGTERYLDALARYLTGRGHDVVTVSTSPGRRIVEMTDGGQRILYPPMWSPPLGRGRIQPTHMFLLTAALALSRMNADAVHSFYFTDAFAANLVKPWKKFRTIFQIHGPPLPGLFYRFLPPERWVVRQAILGADLVVTCSEFVRALIREHYGVEARVIESPIDVNQFPFVAGAPPGPPTLLSVADFSQRYKGVRVLVRAFALVKNQLTDARLRLSGHMSAELQREILEDLPAHVRADIEVLGLGRPEDLPNLYQQSSVMVLPSMWEASAYVMFESWSCGTPVVATAHGGLPEYVTKDVGVLFDPKTDGVETHNAEGLAAAIMEGVRLSQNPRTRQRCRAHAERHSFAVLGAKAESFYARD